MVDEARTMIENNALEHEMPSIEAARVAVRSTNPDPIRYGS
jgi:hypothetical protein